MGKRKQQKPHEMTGELSRAYDEMNRAWGLIRVGMGSLTADEPPPIWSIVELMVTVDDILGNAGLILAEIIDGEFSKNNK
jgi:hypothetical protein